MKYALSATLSKSCTHCGFFNFSLVDFFSLGGMSLSPSAPSFSAADQATQSSSASSLYHKHSLAFNSFKQWFICVYLSQSLKYSIHITTLPSQPNSTELLRYTTSKQIHYFVYHIIMYNYYLLFCMYMYVLDSSSPYTLWLSVLLLVVLYVHVCVGLFQPLHSVAKCNTIFVIMKSCGRGGVVTACVFLIISMLLS